MLWALDGETGVELRGPRQSSWLWGVTAVMSSAGAGSRFRVPGNQGCGQQNGPKHRPGHPAEGSVAPPAMRGAPPGSAGTPALGSSGGSRRMAGSASSRPGDGQSRPDPGLPTKPLALSGLRVRHVESQVTIPEAGAARRGVDTQSRPV